MLSKVRFCKTFIQNLSSWSRRCRFMDWKDLYVSSSFFGAGCILTYMSWKFGASSLFLFLYLFLCAFGMLISCLNKMKVANNLETSPLAPQKQFEMHADEIKNRSVEKFKDILKESLVSSNDKLNEESFTETHCPNTVDDKQNVLIDVDISEAQLNTDGITEDPVSCIERNYDSCVIHEQYVTGPSPGGGNSRAFNENGKEQSKDNILYPLLSPFRQLPPTEASAIFHVPLTEIQDIREDATFSLTENSVVTETGPYMSPNFQQPIYENLNQEPESMSSETHCTRHFDNENLPESLEAVDNKDGAHDLSSSVPVLHDKLKIYQRLRPFSSTERVYANVMPSTDEKRVKQTESSQFTDVSDSSRDSGTAESRKNQQEPLLTSSMTLQYDRLESYKRLEPFISPERIYVNVQPMDGNIDREQNIDNQFLNNTPQTKNLPEISTATGSSQSERIYMNLPNYLYEKKTCIKKKIGMNRTVDSPANTEVDSSETEKRIHTAKSITSSRRDKINSGSGNLSASSSEATPKFHVEQQSVEIKNHTSTLPKLTSPRKHQWNKNDSSNVCSTKNTMEHNASDRKILSVSHLPLKRNKTQSEGSFRVSNTKSSSSNRRRGTNLGEYLSLSYQFEANSRSQYDFETFSANSPNIKSVQHDNPLYVENKSIKNIIQDDNLTKAEKSDKETVHTDDSIVFKMNTTLTVPASSSDTPVSKEALNETFLVNEASSLSANFEENSKSQQYPDLEEKDATFVKQINVTSESEDPICLSTSLKDEMKNFGKDNYAISSYVSSFAKFSISKDSYLEPFSKHTSSTPHYQTDIMHRTKTSDNLFSPRKQTQSVSTASTEEGCLKDSVCNTTFKVSNLEQSSGRRTDSNRVTPASNSRKSPLISPPLDKSYLS